MPACRNYGNCETLTCYRTTNNFRGGNSKLKIFDVIGFWFGNPALPGTTVFPYKVNLLNWELLNNKEKHSIQLNYYKKWFLFNFFNISQIWLQKCCHFYFLKNVKLFRIVLLGLVLLGRSFSIIRLHSFFIISLQIRY